MNITTGKFMAAAIMAISVGASSVYAKTHVQPSAADLALAQKVESQLKDSGVLEKGPGRLH